MEISEPQNLQHTLLNYIKYGDKSSYLNRYSLKELKNLKVSDIMPSYKEAISYAANFEYVGQKDKKQLPNQLLKILAYLKILSTMTSNLNYRLSNTQKTASFILIKNQQFRVR